MHTIKQSFQILVLGVFGAMNINVFAHETYDHRAEHGAQIHAITMLDNQWLLDEQGKGSLNSKFESKIGTDENKLFIQANVEKVESNEVKYDIKALYSRMISDFWDVQVGVRYRMEKQKQAIHITDTEKNVAAVMGLHGLAPYFFETNAYLYMGEDNYTGFSLEIERDFLFTQKLIVKPYLDLALVFNDDAQYAKKSGISDLTVGVESRYEITKKVMPYLDIAHRYDKGIKDTFQYVAPNSQKEWLYGAGIRFRF